MVKFVYRMCLVGLLLVAVAGGVYYYMNVYSNMESPRQGTFVKSTISGLKEAVA